MANSMSLNTEKRILKAAAIQMVSGSNVDANLNTAADLIKAAVTDGAKLIVLPENFAMIAACERETLTIAESFGHGVIQDFLAGASRTHGVWIIGGTLPLAASVADKVRSACLVYAPTGGCVARYDKIHLFDVAADTEGNECYRESATFEAGGEPVVVRTDIANIGLSVCYDLRFPELYRAMLNETLHVITVPAAFTATTGKAHWRTLLKSRAIENLSFVIAADQGGRHNDKRTTWGHSMIVDPWGMILAEVGDGEGIAVAELDLDAQQKTRDRFPCLAHRVL